jgi:hypothetical protein
LYVKEEKNPGFSEDTLVDLGDCRGIIKFKDIENK